MSVVQGYWLLLVTIVVAFAGLLVCRKEVAICVGKLRWFALFVFVTRSLLWLWSGELDWSDIVGISIALLSFAIGQWCARAWLVRTSLSELRAVLTESCDRVRLKYELSQTGETKLQLNDGLAIYSRDLNSGLQWLTFPRLRTGKLHLLECLLRKRYARLIPAISLSSSRVQE